MSRWIFCAVFAVYLPFANASAQPSFKFCGLTFDEGKNIRGLLDQLEGLEQCQPGKGAVWKVMSDLHLKGARY